MTAQPANLVVVRPSRRRGVILLTVLVVVAILLLVGYQFFNLMQAEYEAAVASKKISQVRYLADSGLQYSAFLLAYPQSAGIGDVNSGSWVNPPAVYDNPGLFHQRPVVGANGQVLGYFSLVAPRDSDDPLLATQGFRFGVEDEGGKINLNAILNLPGEQQQQAEQMLARLPGMDEDKAKAIVNWMKASDTADSDDSLYYASMGYQRKGGPFESLEELLLVRGMSPRLLFGNNRNRDGTLDADEDDMNGVIDPGLMRYVTVHSRELNLNAAGLPRININDRSVSLEDLQARLSSVLDPATVNFILMCLYDGPPTPVNPPVNNVGQLVQAIIPQPKPLPKGVTFDGDAPSFKFSDMDANKRVDLPSLFDLVDAYILYQGNRRYVSPLTKNDLGMLRQLLPLVLDQLTTTPEVERRAPRININTAPPEILRAFPNVTDADVQKFLDARPGLDTDPALAPVYSTLAWLVTEAGVDPSLVKLYEPFITAQTQVYRVQVVGYFEQLGPAARLEAIIDTNGGRPRLLLWRDISELGRGFNFANVGLNQP
jgi:type II secretory pathway component PulK